MLLNQHTTYTQTHMHTQQQQQQQYAKSKTKIYGAIKLETTLQAIYLTYSFIHQQQQQNKIIKVSSTILSSGDISLPLTLSTLSLLYVCYVTHTHTLGNKHTKTHHTRTNNHS